MSTLREQIRELAENENYEYRGQLSVKAHACDVFARPHAGDGERVVEIGYTLTGSKVIRVAVNGKEVRPAGKWPAVDALAPRLVS